MSIERKTIIAFKKKFFNTFGKNISTEDSKSLLLQANGNIEEALNLIDHRVAEPASKNAKKDVFYDTQRLSMVSNIINTFIDCINTPLNSDIERKKAKVFNKLVDEFLEYDSSASVDTIALYISEMGVPYNQVMNDIVKYRKL